MQVARERLTADGPVVPLYVHRFLPAGRGRWGHPVLSIWGVDVIFYGADLLDYVQIADWSRKGCPIPPV